MCVCVCVCMCVCVGGGGGRASVIKRATSRSLFRCYLLLLLGNINYT